MWQPLVYTVCVLFQCLAFPLSDTNATNITHVVNSTIIRTNQRSPLETSLVPSHGFTATRTATVTGAPFLIQFPTSASTITATTTIGSLKSSWEAPPLFHDLDAFSITNFPVGQHNLAIVTSIPASASASPIFQDENTANSTAMLQILYPAHSINPGRGPQGGSEFYAVPLNISEAQSVTLRYSVFFPIDFDWVLAGKLPGLYGGHSGCSGGNQATDCFSTRLMWRRDGVGELYLYAPRDKQATELCLDSRSVCDSTYGISIGRGTFNWSAGRWTNVAQTVSLNTPGSQDGTFTLDVNDVRVIDRHDMFYRDVPSSLKSNEEPVWIAAGKRRDSPCMWADSSNLADRVLWNMVDSLFMLVPWYSGAPSECSSLVSPDTTTLVVTRTIDPVKLSPPLTETSIVVVTATLPSPTPKSTKSPIPSVGFVGLFFSTFFGGHEDQFATPRDQFAWFKDFQIIYHL